MRLRFAFGLPVLLVLGACQIESRPDGSSVLRTGSIADLLRAGQTPASVPASRVGTAPADPSNVGTLAGPLRVSASAIAVGQSTVLRAPAGGWMPPPSVVALAPSAEFPAIALLMFPGGTACPATYRLVDTMASPPFVTAEFGTCSDLAEVSTEERQVTVSMPAPGGGRAIWRYDLGRQQGQRGTLVQVGGQRADANQPRPNPEAAPAGASQFRASFTPEARSDLLQLLRLHGWSDRNAQFALDHFARALEIRSARALNAYQEPSAPRALDAVNVVASAEADGRTCSIGSVALANPLRPRTIIAGRFCGSTPTTWGYDARFLQVTDVNEGNQTLRASDASALGRARPR